MMYGWLMHLNREDAVGTQADRSISPIFFSLQPRVFLFFFFLFFEKQG